MNLFLATLVVLFGSSVTLAEGFPARIQCLSDGPVYPAYVEVPNLPSDWTVTGAGNTCQLVTTKKVIIYFAGFTYIGEIEPIRFNRLRREKENLSCAESFGKYGFVSLREYLYYSPIQTHLSNQNGYTIGIRFGGRRAKEDLNSERLNPPYWFEELGGGRFCSIAY